jgi:demethylmenaquinone methyltransferase/2-methoxy-6-polyprenyl-1,4-benzoquinol methylase
MSLGRDGAWKKALVNSLPDFPSPLCVDLACGTGDLSFLLAEKYPGGRIVGLDLSGPMIDLARERNRCGNVRFARMDMSAPGFSAGTVDVVTGGYALRNATELGPVLDEVRRILKPGGVAAFLDFAKPATRFLQAPERWLLAAWCGFWGLALHADPGIHGGYIASSLSSFPDRSMLRELIVSRGLEPVSSRRFFLGITELFVFRKRMHPEARPRPAAS